MRSASMLSIQLGVQTHFGIEHFGYWTTDLGLACGVLERDIAGTRTLALTSRWIWVMAKLPSF